MSQPRDRIVTGRGQESVWDYPRPPRVEPLTVTVRIALGDMLIAESSRAMRALETSHPPAIYVPPEDVRTPLLTRNARSTFCEFKGQASYYDLTNEGEKIENVAWFYPTPTLAFAALAGFLAFYPSKVECYIAGERATAQAGDFYGGWITSRIVGPFKGGEGTLGW